MKTLLMISVLVLVLVLSAIPAGAEGASVASGSVEAVVQAVVQALIDLPGLQPYLHPEVPGRVPLVLADGVIGQNLALSKFGQPVRILPKAGIKEQPFLEITRLETGSGSVSIEFRYPVEGVAGSARFVREGQAWKVAESSVVEH